MDDARLRVELVGHDRTDLVYRLTRSAFAEYHGLLDPPSGAETETLDIVAADIAAGVTAVALRGGAAIGAVRCEPRPDHLYAGRLAVLPSHRGRGVGSALMAFAEAQAAALGVPEVRVEVRSALPGNVAFFCRLGYAVVAVRPHHRSPAATTVVLAKRLRTGAAESGRTG